MGNETDIILTDYEKYENIRESDRKTALEILKEAQQEIRNDQLSNRENVIIILNDEKNYNPAQFELCDDKNRCVGHYVGFLYSEEEGRFLRIRSRFDEENKPFFSDYILSKVFEKYSWLFKDSSFSEGSSENIEWLLAIVFASKLNQAFKKGVYRKYRNYEKNDSKVRGRIDASRHIRQNPLFNGNVAYTCREYTADNDVNRLILTTCKMLEKKYPWFRQVEHGQKNVKDYIDQISRSFMPASKTEVHTLVRHCTHKITHPVYCDWESVRLLAIAIQRHLGNLGDNPKGNLIIGILVDIDWAWEQYLEEIFRKYIKEELYELKTQNSYNILKPGDKRKIRPDFLWQIKNRESYPLILDAKNKPVWENVVIYDAWKDDRAGSDSYQEETIRHDLYQVFSYMLVLNAPAGGIVCPVNSFRKSSAAGNPGVSDEKKDVQGPYKISQYCPCDFYVFGLPVDAAGKESFADFQKTMEYREEQFGKKVEEVLINSQRSSAGMNRNEPIGEYAAGEHIE